MDQDTDNLSSRTEARIMVDAARDYCDLISQVPDMADDNWLRQVSLLLPRLHGAILALGEPDPDGPHLGLQDYDERFDLYTSLRTVLGERDSYWMEFDVAQDGQTMSGSLADDLTDIYFELRHGLDLLDMMPPHPALALNDWQLGYHLHWGKHLLDAERHLYELNACHQLAAG